MFWKYAQCYLCLHFIIDVLVFATLKAKRKLPRVHRYVIKQLYTCKEKNTL